MDRADVVSSRGVGDVELERKGGRERERERGREGEREREREEGWERERERASMKSQYVTCNPRRSRYSI